MTRLEKGEQKNWLVFAQDSLFKAVITPGSIAKVKFISHRDHWHSTGIDQKVLIFTQGEKSIWIDRSNQ